jgi:flavin-dependent dehydrogenase
MSKNTLIPTAIIGAGISGLACARVLENAGHRDPSMEGVEPSDDVSYERRDRSGSGGAGTPAAEAEDDEDQSSLGDF